MVLEKRLGHEVYRQIGEAWAEKGFWNVYSHPDTIKQYLGIRQDFIPKDQTVPLNKFVKEPQDGIYYCEDVSNKGWNRGITWEKFMETDFDVILASLPQHIEPFKRLIREYKPKAKFIFQMGNMFSQVMNNLHEIPNLLASTIKFPVPTSCNAVFYHQMYDVDLFSPSSLFPEKLITSFVNLLPQTSKGYLYYMLKSELIEYDFKSYGILTDDGIINTTDDIAWIMKRSAFGYHVKSGADGFGHIIHNWISSGKPVIVNYGEYKSTLAGKLLIPDETCFVLDADSDIKNVAEKISELPPYKYHWMCQQTYNKFKEIVDYDRETEEIKKFLERLN